MNRILYIEPDPELNRSTTESLQQAGYAVEAFLNPAEALSRARTQRYDLLITEYKMPFLSGTQVIRQIMELQLIPVIITSSSPADVMDETLSRLPVRPKLLKKPFEIWELTDRIEETLKK